MARPSTPPPEPELEVADGIPLDARITKLCAQFGYGAVTSAVKEAAQPNLEYMGISAGRWAAEFVAVNPGVHVDEGTMIAWFANAIEAGRTHEHNNPRGTE